MSIPFNDEQIAFRREAIAFIQANADPSWLSIDPNSEAYRKIGREMDRKLIDKGWFTLHWPKEYGGRGDFILYSILRELEGYFRVPTYGGFGRYIAGTALIEYGSKEQQDRYLPSIANGERIISLGYTEAMAGSDLGAMQTKATADGDGFILSGAKLFITYAHYANTFVVAARTDPTASKYKGVSLFIIEMNLPGINVTPMMCLTGNYVSEVTLDNVRIPKECLLGQLNRGFYHMAVALNYERSFIDHPALYMAQLEDVVEYCRLTGLWDRPQVRQIIGHLKVELEVWRAVCWRVAILQTRGTAPSWEGSLAQVYRKDFNPKFGRALLEILGPHAVVERGSEHAVLAGRVEWYLREALDNHGQGGRFVTRNVIARRGLNLPVAAA